MVEKRLSVRRRSILAAFVCAVVALLSAVEGAAGITQTSDVTSVIGSAYGYYASVSLFGGPPSAVAVRKGVLIRWRTASEIQTLGYNVYREFNGSRTRANRSLIAGKGGGSYWLLDRGAMASKAVRYWIQAVSLENSRRWFGPALVRGRSSR